MLLIPAPRPPLSIYHSRKSRIKITHLEFQPHYEVQKHGRCYVVSSELREQNEFLVGNPFRWRGASGHFIHLLVQHRRRRMGTRSLCGTLAAAPLLATEFWPLAAISHLVNRWDSRPAGWQCEARGAAVKPSRRNDISIYFL